MTNNDVLKRIRYSFDFDDTKMMELFELANHKVTRAEVSDWLKKEKDPAYKELTDPQLALFLNGLINDKRGKREGAQPEPEKRITNNIILKKLKIALNLKTEDIVALFELAGKSISPHELSAFFRNPKQEKYKPCKDQYLRNFLEGIQVKYRDDRPSNPIKYKRVE